MQNIIIGSQNPHKQKKLKEIVSSHFNPIILPEYPDLEEHGDTFEEIARNKSLDYAKLFNGRVISTDGGAVIPALSNDDWQPLKTRRFGKTDKERIEKLLSLMKDKSDRTIQWFEAISIATPEKVLFSTTARAMDGVIDKVFNPEFYQDGIWICSITSFPEFNGRNFFELTEEEKDKTEDSWSELKNKIDEFLSSK